MHNCYVDQHPSTPSSHFLDDRLKKLGKWDMYFVWCTE